MVSSSQTLQYNIELKAKPEMYKSKSNRSMLFSLHKKCPWTDASRAWVILNIHVSSGYHNFGSYLFHSDQTTAQVAISC